MSIYDKSSLVLIPSGTKTGKVFSQKPVSGDGDFTFTRASAATRVNADGNIEKETQNLFSGSGDLANTSYWPHSNIASATGGQAGYDGTSNAVKIVESTSAGQHIIQQIVLSPKVVQTISIYAKAAERTWLEINQSGIRIAYYDLSTGALGSVDSNIIDATISDVGGGWYRCTYTADMDYTGCRIGLATGNGGASYTGDGTSGILIQDAQLEQGLVARDYQETTTAAVYGGITDNTPRLDYTDSSCPALLLEPQRTNNVPHSEYHQGSIAAVTRTYNTSDTLSPEGVYNAVKYEVDENNSDPYLRVFNIPTSGNVATFSLYVKGASGQLFSMIFGRDGYNELEYEAFTLDGTWQRLDISKTFTTTPTTLTIGAEFSHSSDDGVLGQEYYLYGLQVEAASYATSYIPTYGSSVSRVADASSVTGVSDLIGQSEGTLFAEFEIKSANTDNFNRIIAIGDGTSNNRIMIFANNDEKPRAFVTNSGSTQVSIIGNTSILGGTHKIAFAYKANDFVLYMDGVSLGTDTSGSVPSVSNIYLATAEDSNTRPIEGDLNEALLFKTRLSNEELAALTTI